MPDYFTLLKEPRRPWLDSESLKQKFLALSAEVHPDRFHAAAKAENEAAHQQSAELNAAHACLREPKDRLLHLLELETGSRPKDIQRIPPGTMDVFVEVGQLCRSVDDFLAERSRMTSPLLKVQVFERGQEWVEKLTGLQQRLNARRGALEAELKQLDAAWQAAPPIGSAERAAALPLERIEQLYRIFSYVGRWTAQVQERLVQLAI